jgi:pimeloyl-ACP methyl ester carboxylesterase
MARILLVHGYAVDTRFSVFRSRLGPEAGFLGFRGALASGDARVFRWGREEDATFFEALNPWHVHGIYRRELARVLDPLWQKRLWEAMTDPSIETVVAHSMGCRFVLETLRRYGAPPHLKRVVLVQGDVAVEEMPPGGSVSYFNLFCPWDVTLLVSALVHRSWRIGLRRWERPGVRNVWFPLWRPFNVHTASLRSPRLLRWLSVAERVS